MNPEQIGKNIAKRILVEEFTEKVVLYPGAFKPPHRGHVATILGSNNEFVDKYIVFVSTKTREDVEVEESIKAWNLYKQTIPGLENVEFVPTATPVKAVYDYANENPTHDIRTVFGKGESSRFDRLKDPEKYPNVEIFDAGTEGDYSATGLRQAIRDKDINKIQTIIPAEINPDSFLNIFDQVDEAIYPMYNAKQVQRTRYKASDVYTNDPVEESIVENKIHCDNCGWEWKIVDGGDDLFICHKCGHDNTPIRENKYLNEADPKKGTGKKPKGSSRRLYTDEDPKDTVGIKFSSRQDIVDTLNKASFKAKSHARQSQIINLIHQRTRAAYNRAKEPDVKKRLKTALNYIKGKKEASKKKTQRLKKENKYLNEARFKNLLNEQWEDHKAHIINHFTDYATNYLSIDRPKIKVITDPQYTQMHHSFGGYMPSTKNISVVVHNRNMADILRTLAHELVHHMQNLDDRLQDNSGDDGSPEENEANALAAVIMRQYGRENSHIYE